MLCCVCVSKRELNRPSRTIDAHELAAPAPPGLHESNQPVSSHPKRKQRRKQTGQPVVRVLAPNPTRAMRVKWAEGIRDAITHAGSGATFKQQCFSFLWPPFSSKYGPPSVSLLPLVPVFIKNTDRDGRERQKVMGPDCNLHSTWLHS